NILPPPPGGSPATPSFPPSPRKTIVLVTSGEARPPCPRGGSFRCLIAGLSRGPFPLATAQRIVPLFKSMAVSRPYGGLKGVGSPRGPCRYGPYDRPRGLRIHSFLPSLAFTISVISWCCTHGTHRPPASSQRGEA